MTYIATTQINGGEISFWGEGFTPSEALSDFINCKKGRSFSDYCHSVNQSIGTVNVIHVFSCLSSQEGEEGALSEVALNTCVQKLQLPYKLAPKRRGFKILAERQHLHAV